MDYTYHAVSHTALMLLGDVGHIGEYNGEGNGKHSRYRDNGKVPPETQQDLKCMWFKMCICVIKYKQTKILIYYINIY